VNGRFFLYLSIFLVMQTMAQLAMKFGSQASPSRGGAGSAVATLLRRPRWWLGFGLANGVGAPSILFLRELYKALPDRPNIVAIVAMSGTLLVSQPALAIVFRSRLRPLRWLGITLLAVGAILAGGAWNAIAKV